MNKKYLSFGILTTLFTPLVVTSCSTDNLIYIIKRKNNSNASDDLVVLNITGIINEGYKVYEYVSQLNDTADGENVLFTHFVSNSDDLPEGYNKEMDITESISKDEINLFYFTWRDKVFKTESVLKESFGVVMKKFDDSISANFREFCESYSIDDNNLKTGLKQLGYKFI